MKTDITDKLTPELRERWLELFRTKVAAEDTADMVLRSMERRTKSIRTNEKLLWQELRAALPLPPNASIGCDFNSATIFIDGDEPEPPHENAK